MTDSAHIADALVPSRFLGVDVLDLKLAFYQMKDRDHYGQILRMLSNLEEHLPMEIKSIKGFDKNLEIEIQLYGLSGRA